MQIILTELQMNLVFGVILLLILAIAFFFRFFSFHRYSKDLDIYLCIKRNIYKGKTRAHIMEVLLNYYGFDVAGASEMYDRAKMDDLAWFQGLEL